MTDLRKEKGLRGARAQEKALSRRDSVGKWGFGTELSNLTRRMKLIIMCIVIIMILSFSSILYYVVFPIDATIICTIKGGQPSRSESTIIFSGNVSNHGIHSYEVALNLTLRYFAYDGSHFIEMNRQYGLGNITPGNSVYFNQHEIVRSNGGIAENYYFNYRVILL